MKTNVLFKLGYYVLIVLITVLAVCLFSSCQNDPIDDFAQKPICYFPVQIINVDCETSDTWIDLTGIGNYDPEWEKEMMEEIWKQIEEGQVGESPLYVKTDFKDILWIVNKYYIKSHIQFYIKNDPIMVSYDEYIKNYDIRSPINGQITVAFIETIIWDTFDRDYMNNGRAAGYGQLGGTNLWVSAIYNDSKYLFISASTLIHEMDHLFGWNHGDWKDSGTDKWWEDVRDPQKLYENSFKEPKNSMSSDKPL